VPTTVSTSRRAAALPPDERRAAIVHAVLPLLAVHGEAVTSRQIAEAAGVAEGTIFRAFADKDELFAAALDSVLDPEPLERAFAEIDPGLDFEQRLVEATELARLRVVEVWQIVSQLHGHLREHATRPVRDSAALTALFADERDRIRVEPEEAARVLRALTLAMTHPLLTSEAVPASDIVAVVLRGIGAER
jgi:AcrR family transcriptional regulator